MRLDLNKENLNRVAAHFQIVFGRNNAVFVTSLGKRISRVARMAKRLHDSHRKNEGLDVLRKRIGHLTSWFFALVNHFPTINIAEEMSRKFPRKGCAYCGHPVCTGCTPANRKQHQAGQVDLLQVERTLDDWQEALVQVYGKANADLGIAEVFNRLRDEIDEVQEIHDGIVHVGCTAREITNAYGSEFADILAWIFGTASLLGISVSASIEQYADGCPGCNHYPCEQCAEYIVDEEGRILSRLYVGTRPWKQGA